MASEIERKFLVGLPFEWPGERIESSGLIDQGYLTPRGAAVEVRVRRVREVTKESARLAVPASKTGAQGVYRVWKMTVKVAAADDSGGLVREEVETDLSEAEFDRLWPLTKGRRIQKVRTIYVPLRTGRDACFDDFRGNLTGLAMVEVEFESVEAAEAFVPPPFFGTEVTDDSRYRNDALADADKPPEK